MANYNGVGKEKMLYGQLSRRDMALVEYITAEVFTKGITWSAHEHSNSALFTLYKETESDPALRQDIDTLLLAGFSPEYIEHIKRQHQHRQQHLRRQQRQSKTSPKGSEKAQSPKRSTTAATTSPPKRATTPSDPSHTSEQRTHPVTALAAALQETDTFDSQALSNLATLPHRQRLSNEEFLRIARLYSLHSGQGHHEAKNLVDLARVIDTWSTGSDEYKEILHNLCVLIELFVATNQEADAKNGFGQRAFLEGIALHYTDAITPSSPRDAYLANELPSPPVVRQFLANNGLTPATALTVAADISTHLKGVTSRIVDKDIFYQSSRSEKLDLLLSETKRAAHVAVCNNIAARYHSPTTYHTAFPYGYDAADFRESLARYGELTHAEQQICDTLAPDVEQPFPLLCELAKELEES